MVKPKPKPKKRTPQFITGIGDGHAGGIRGNNGDTQAKNNNNLQQQGAPLAGFHHPVAGGASKTTAGTDDIFHVTQHIRRNNNNNNNINNPNNYRLRSAVTATNERLARMQLMDEGRESRWDMILTSSSQDGSGRGGVGGFSNPIGSAEQWQMSAFALVGMLVFLSALFLHLVSDSASSSGSGGGSSSHYHHHHGAHHSNGSSKYRRSHRTKRKISSGTRKKWDDEWSSDEEASKDDGRTADAIIHRVDSDGQASGSAAVTPNNPAQTATAAKTPLFYPYQPRHRKPSVNGQKETFAGTAAYSPSAAANGFHSRNYFLNPIDGPAVMLPSFQSPSSSAKARLGSPNPYQNTPTRQQQLQQTDVGNQINGNSNANICTSMAATGTLAVGGAAGEGGEKSTNNDAPEYKSPAHPHRLLVTDLDDEFVATGLDPPAARNDIINNIQHVGTRTPQSQHRQQVQLLSTPKAASIYDDEESQHHLSDASASPLSALRYNPMSPSSHHQQQQQLAASSPGHWPSYTHDDNAYTSYGQVNNSVNFGDDSNNLGNGSTASSMLGDSTHHHSNHNSYQRQRLSMTSNHSGTGMLSPRIEVDMMDLEETPRAGLTRRTVDIRGATPQRGPLGGGGGNYNPRRAYQAFTEAQRRQQYLQRTHSKDSNNSSNSNDPYHVLRLPQASTMGMMETPTRARHVEQGNLELDVPLPLQEGLGSDNFPLLPKLDMAAAAAKGCLSEQMSSVGTRSTAPPRSMSIEELHLYKMESGSAPHWQVRDSPFVNRNANAGAILLSPVGQVMNEASTASDYLSVESSSNGEFYEENAENNNEARKSIIHKRDKITDATDAAASLQSSIKFPELKLEEVIGGGGFGQVWKAVWRGTPVAVKVLTGSAQAKHVSKAILEEFAAEINLLSGMRHPNICLYMGCCLDPPNRAIITELAANGSLWDALRLPLNAPFSASDGFSRHTWPSELYIGKHGTPPSSTGTTLPPVAPVGSWPWILVKQVACGAARGMAYLHSGTPPILHRDLKSANILLSESYTAKVCDFGLSRIKSVERSMTGNCGTVQWMAPEVLAQQNYNEKADIYSYGIICIELLSRECPYEGMSAIQCALAVLNRDQRPDIPRWCPPSLRALVLACIKKNPDERPTFSQIISALDAMP